MNFPSDAKYIIYKGINSYVEGLLNRQVYPVSRRTQSLHRYGLALLLPGYGNMLLSADPGLLFHGLGSCVHQCILLSGFAPGLGSVYIARRQDHRHLEGVACFIASLISSRATSGTSSPTLSLATTADKIEASGDAFRVAFWGLGSPDLTLAKPWVLGCCPYPIND